jgi:hypothetical protein
MFAGALPELSLVKDDVALEEIASIDGFEFERNLFGLHLK